MSKPTNAQIAEALDRISELLEVQGANSFRVKAFRDAARAVETLPESVCQLMATMGGRERLDALPTVGKSIAGAIEELCRTGRLGLLDRLEGQVSPEELFGTVPGIGPKLAARLHRELDIETLPELEQAVHDGRLEKVPGFGARRSRALREELGYLLSRSMGRRRQVPGERRPPVHVLLSVDADYRREAAAGRLRKIAPRRFNPRTEKWLPIYHVDRDGWSFTALFSNTARAHELGRTNDWVIIFYEQDGDEGQCTVVTERGGPLRGERVVRGRESDCRTYYARTAA